MPNRDTFSRGELRERRNRWKHTQKSIIPLALITHKSQRGWIEYSWRENTQNVENQNRKEDWRCELMRQDSFFFFSFFPSVTLWIFNDKTFRHHFLPLVPSYLVAPTFSLLTDQFGYPTQHLCPMPPFLLSWLSSSSPKKKKSVRFKTVLLLRLRLFFDFLVVVVWKHCVMHSELGFSYFSPWWYTVAERDWGSTQLVAQLL